MALDKIEIAEVDIAQPKKTIKDLRKEIKDLKDELLNLEEGTKEYNTTLGKLADAQFTMREINEQARYSAADYGEKLATVTRITGNLTAGIGAATGVFKLFGIESETLNKSMVQLQSIIALVQGLNGLDGLNKNLRIASIQFKASAVAAKGFIAGLSGIKKALLATGIGAFIVLVGSLIAYWENITKLFNDTSAEEAAEEAIKNLDGALKNNATTLSEKNITALQEYTKALNEAGNNVTVIAEATERYNKALQDNNIAKLRNDLQEYQKVEEATHKAYVKNQSEANTEAFLKAKEDRIKAEQALNLELSRIDNEAAKKRAEEYTKTYNETKAAAQKKYEEEKAQKIKNEKDFADLKKRLTDEAQVQLDALAESRKKDRETAIQHYKELAKDGTLTVIEAKRDMNNVLKQIDADYWESIYELQAKWSTQSVEEQKKKSEEIVNGVLSQITAIKQLAENNITTTELDSDESALGNTPEEQAAIEQEKQNSILEIKRNAVNEEIELYQELLKNQSLIADDRLQIEQSLFDAQVKLRQQNLAEEEKAQKREKALDEMRQKQKKDLVNATKSALGALANVLGENTAAGKAAAIAQTTIDTYQAAQAAYLNGITYGGPAGPYLAAIQMATAIGIGIANVKSILSTDTKTGNSNLSASSAAATAVPTLAYNQTLPVGYTRNLLGDQETEELNRDNRVYVVESDITDTQNRVKVAEENSTF